MWKWWENSSYSRPTSGKSEQCVERCGGDRGRTHIDLQFHGKYSEKSNSYWSYISFLRMLHAVEKTPEVAISRNQNEAAIPEPMQGLCTSTQKTLWLCYNPKVYANLRGNQGLNVSWVGRCGQMKFRRNTTRFPHRPFFPMPLQWVFPWKGKTGQG